MKKNLLNFFRKKLRDLTYKEEIDTNMVLECLDVKLDKAMLDIFLKLKKKFHLLVLLIIFLHNNK